MRVKAADTRRNFSRRSCCAASRRQQEARPASAGALGGGYMLELSPEAPAATYPYR